MTLIGVTVQLMQAGRWIGLIYLTLLYLLTYLTAKRIEFVRGHPVCAAVTLEGRSGSPSRL